VFIHSEYQVSHRPPDGKNSKMSVSGKEGMGFQSLADQTSNMFPSTTL